jgi:hypothetical protein
MSGRGNWGQTLFIVYHEGHEGHEEGSYPNCFKMERNSVQPGREIKGQLSARLFFNASSTFSMESFDSELNFGVVSLFLSMVLI